MIFPFYWMIVTSLKPLSEAVQAPPTLIPHRWMFANYAEAWRSVPFARYFANTVFISAVVTAGVILTSALAAHAFSRMEFRGKNAVFAGMLATMMIPFEVILIPDFVLIKNLGWYNTYQAMILPWAANVFSIFLLRQFFMTIPVELYEAAILDGCSSWIYLWKVAMPISTPALVTIGIFSFLGSWNSLLWPLIVTSEQKMRPIQVGLAYFQTDQGTYYNLLMAGATLTILPIVILFLFAQRHFVESIARTGLKG
ncbi:MAG: carbohydrate ABC transporter permease [Armatimonadetes bacterium]|nr:carbohydrate ABC transporter permease [Armatimonadota bacterium]